MDICNTVEKPAFDTRDLRNAAAASQMNVSEVVTKVGEMQQDLFKQHQDAMRQMLTDFRNLQTQQLQEQREMLESLDKKLDAHGQTRLRQGAIAAVPVSGMHRKNSKSDPRSDGKHHGDEHSKVPLMGGVPDHDKKADAALRKQYLGTLGWEKRTQRSASGLPDLAKKRSSTNDHFGVKIDATDACQRFFVKLVHNNVFTCVSSCLVVANSVMIGVQVDMDLRRAQRSQSPLSWESTVDLCFSGAFLLEILLRLLAERLIFFVGPVWRWNIFDMVVVGLGFVDLIDVLNVNFTVLRVLRVVRVVRILRVIRIFKIFRELRMMALSILSCLNSLVWAFSLLLIVMYIFIIVLLEGARDYLRNDNIDAKIKEQLSEWYPGVIYTLYTLLQAISGGNSWGDVAQPYIAIANIYGLLFTMFIIFIMFGLLNVLVGVFVQNTEAIANIDRDFVLQEEMNRKSSNINKLRELFNQVDIDGSGTISWKELKANLTDDSMKAYFAMMQIEIDEAEGLFNLLDIDESGEVAIEEFIMGCMRLKGAAKSIDLASLLYENKRLHVMIHRYMTGLYHEIETIHHVLTPEAFDMAAPATGENPNGA